MRLRARTTSEAMQDVRFALMQLGQAFAIPMNEAITRAAISAHAFSESVFAIQRREMERYNALSIHGRIAYSIGRDVASIRAWLAPVEHWIATKRYGVLYEDVALECEITVSFGMQRHRESFLIKAGDSETKNMTAANVKTRLTKDGVLLIDIDAWAYALQKRREQEHASMNRTVTNANKNEFP